MIILSLDKVDGQAVPKARLEEKITCNLSDLALMLFLLETGAYAPVFKAMLENKMKPEQIEKMVSVVHQLRQQKGTSAKVKAAQIPIVKAHERS